MSTIKRSMSVRPSPIDVDGVAIPRHPNRNDMRWEGPDWSCSRKWTGPWGYIVARVTNSTEYRPGWLLTKAKVDALINDGWTVAVLSRV
jgi:hypothetical protein